MGDEWQDVGPPYPYLHDQLTAEGHSAEGRSAESWSADSGVAASSGCPAGSRFGSLTAERQLPLPRIPPFPEGYKLQEPGFWRNEKEERIWVPYSWGEEADGFEAWTPFEARNPVTMGEDDQERWSKAVCAVLRRSTYHPHFRSVGRILEDIRHNSKNELNVTSIQDVLAGNSHFVTSWKKKAGEEDPPWSELMVKVVRGPEADKCNICKERCTDHEKKYHRRDHRDRR